MTPVTWNPVDRTNGLYLGSPLLRATQALPVGKIYWEVRMPVPAPQKATR